MGLTAITARTGRRERAYDTVSTRLGARAMTSRLAISDAVAIVLAVLGAHIARFGTTDAALAVGSTEISYPAVAVAMAVGWILALTVGRTRDPLIVGVASQETRAIVDWTLRLFGVFAVIAFAAKFDLARAFFLVALLLGLTLLLCERWAWRQWLARQRAAGRLVRRVLAVGDTAAVTMLARRLEKVPTAGYRLAGTCDPLSVDRSGRLPTGAVSAVVSRAKALDVDAVAFVAPDEVSAHARRRIDWALREDGIDVIHVPPLDAVAGARLWTEMVGGLPLIHAVKAAPTARDGLKRAFDVVVSLAAIAVCALPALVIAAAIKLDSPGPALFVQRRIGRNGRPFPMVKFRTMRVGAEDERDQLADDGNGVLFKCRRDPRVTRIGHFLRRYSLDELPQFVNVLAGHMSVVGPRPPLPEEVAQYSDTALRRLLVNPGITGLWQISGRSDLSWDESVRLDLLYVDTWSVLKDAGICFRTVRAVVRGEGAY